MADLEMERLTAAVKGKKIHLFGPPGCGKGNRSKDLRALGLVHVGSGIALRAKVAEDPEAELSQRAQDAMTRGDLVSDDIVVPIVMEYLQRPECLRQGFVLDGFPRTRAQAEVLFESLELDLVLHLDVPREFLTFGVVGANRRACRDCAAGYSDFDPPKAEGRCDRCGGEIVSRADDNAETIANRLDLYDAETRAFLPDLEARGIVEVLPITVAEDEDVPQSQLKTLKGQVYRVETEAGPRRMLNLEGMRLRLYGFLTERYA